MGRRGITLTVIGACLAVALVAGCSAQTKQKVMAFFFDGYSAEPRPPKRRVKRDYEKEIEQLKTHLSAVQDELKAAKAGKALGGAPPPAAKAKTWSEAAEHLPKDEQGHVDWVAALEAGAVAPRAGLDATAPEQAVLDLDVELVPAGMDMFKVVFPHQAHTGWLTCKNCHPAIFPLGRDAKPAEITMAKIQKGEYCGVCHGKVAFGVDTCARCHVAMGGPVAQAEESAPAPGAPRGPGTELKTWEEARKALPQASTGGVNWVAALDKGTIAPQPGLMPKAKSKDVMDLNVELVPTGMEMFKVVFPHKAHTAVLGCDNCHMEIFQMAKGADPITMEKINAGEYCGVCHGKVAFGVEACPRCHMAMGGPVAEVREETLPAEAPTPKQGEGTARAADGVPKPTEPAPEAPAPGPKPTEAGPEALAPDQANALAAPQGPGTNLKTWDQATKTLPQASTGGVNWVAALDKGTIAPQPGLTPEAKSKDVMDLNVELVPTGMEMFKVVFPHKAHTAWLGCENCHSGIFQMAKGADPITMEKINAGEYCGVCHGKVAFGVDACARCHPAMAEQPAQTSEESDAKAGGK